MKPPHATKIRIDQLLVDRNMAPSREKARALILAGQVTVDGRRVDKAGQNVSAEGRVEVLQPMRYVSRGGLKLEAALEHFPIAVEGQVAIDVGASTGGFTDCLLQHGAVRVYSIDVGTGQLDWKLRNDPRVISREHVNARYLDAGAFPELMDLAVCDVSFISVTMILPMLPPILKRDAAMVVLVKPQFELERHQVGRGGIVREPELHAVACRRVAEAAGALGFVCETIPSPVLGAEGNQEFLLYARH
jgi:23S rRNA (cytidine1920-2'-O)/16S rRNA (cytidine1409-2'-O)-methyltransferase